MAKQRYVNTRFWDDGYIVSLDPTEKLLFLYLITNPLTEISGAYEIPLRRIAFDTGIDREMVLRILERFADADKIIYRDGWILICNFIKHQSVNPKITKGIETAVKCCPDWIKDRLCIAYDSLSHLNTNSNTNSNAKSALPTDAFSGRAGIPRTLTPINSSSDLKLNTWLDAIAAATGAKDGRSLSKLRKWEAVCMTAIREDRDLGKFLSVIESEKQRTKGQEEFFSPDTCLQKLQLNGSQPKPDKWMHNV